jgi:hypothetical protein
MFGIAVIPSILLALGMAFSPESPRWLFQVCLSIDYSSPHRLSSSHVHENTTIGMHSLHIYECQSTNLQSQIIAKAELFLFLFAFPFGWMKQGKIAEAETAIKRLYGKEKVVDVMLELRTGSATSTEPDASWFDLFSKRYWKGTSFSINFHV